MLQPNVRKDELFGIPKSTENSSLMEIKTSQLGLTSRNPGPPSYAPLLARRPRATSSIPTTEPVVVVKVEELGIDQKPKTSQPSLKSRDCNRDATTEASNSKSELSEEVKISIVDASLLMTPAVLTKPPPLVKITPPEGSSSSITPTPSNATTVLSIPKWGWVCEPSVFSHFVFRT